MRIIIDGEIYQLSKEDKIRKISLLEGIKDLIVDVPHFLSRYIVDKVSIDRKNIIKIIDLEYDERLGLISTGEKRSSNFL